MSRKVKANRTAGARRSSRPNPDPYGEPLNSNNVPMPLDGADKTSSPSHSHNHGLPPLETRNQLGPVQTPPPGQAGLNTVSAIVPYLFQSDDEQVQDETPLPHPKPKLMGSWTKPLDFGRAPGRAPTRPGRQLSGSRDTNKQLDEDEQVEKDQEGLQDQECHNDEEESGPDWQIVGPRGRALRRLHIPRFSSSSSAPSSPRRSHPHGHPQENKSPLPPGCTHRPFFNLGFSQVTFGKVVHTDKVDELFWSDRPAVVVGANMAARRVRIWCIFSYSEAGGLEAKYSNDYYARHPLRERYMRNCVLIDDGRTAAHLGTPVVRLQGAQLAKTSYVDISEVRELPFEHVCRESVGRSLQEMWLPVDQMLKLRKHVERQGNSLVPSVEGGRLDSYSGEWVGFFEYMVDGI